jgi:putative membrane protein
MMWWNHGNAGAGSWIAMSLMMLVFVGALVALGVWLLRSTRTTADHTHAAHAQTADEVLASRFANGEIDESDYTRRRELLSSTGTPTATK